MGQTKIRRGVVLALLVGGLVAAQDAAAATGVQATAAHAPRVATSNWEGTVDGYQASFKVIRYPGFFGSGYEPYAFEDVVLMTPTGCTESDPFFDGEEITGDHFPTPLRSSGSFGLNPKT